MGSRGKRLVSSARSGLDIALLQARRREPNRGSQVSRAKPGATLSPFMTQKSEPVFDMGHKLSLAQGEPQQSGSGCDSALSAMALVTGCPAIQSQ